MNKASFILLGNEFFAFLLFGFGFVSKKVAALFFWRAAKATRYFKNKAD